MIRRIASDAISDAQAKAKKLAKSLGVKLVRVVNFYDNTGSIPYYGEAMGGDVFKTTAAIAPSIAPGENKTTVEVTVVYEIR